MTKEATEEKVKIEDNYGELKMKHLMFGCKQKFVSML